MTGNIQKKMSDNFTPYAIIMGDYADKEAIKRYGEELPGGKRDAFRHLVWQANLQRNYPSIAKMLGDLHESRYFPILGGRGQGEAERQMDLFNNELGRRIADQAKSEEDVYRIAEEMIRQEKAKILPIDQVQMEYKYK